MKKLILTLTICLITLAAFSQTKLEQDRQAIKSLSWLL
jgi:hypothetical protein